MSDNVIQFPIRKELPQQESNVIALVDLIDIDEMNENRANNAISSMLMSLEEDGIATDDPSIHELIYPFKIRLLKALAEATHEG